MSKASTQAALDIKVFPATVHLSTAQIADLHNTAVECVPAPGVGKALVVLGFAGKKTLNSVAFSGGVITRLIYGLSGSMSEYAYSAPGSVMSALADRLFVGVQNTGGVSLAAASMENQPICVKAAAAANLTSGAISTFTIAAGGSNYQVNDVLSVSGSFGAGGTITVATVDGGGAILTATLAEGGEAYEVESAVGLDGGSGSGGQVDITAIDVPPAGNGSLDVTVLYAEIPV